MSAEERRYVVEHLVRQKQKAPSVTSITNLGFCRYVAMRSLRHPEPNAQLVGAQVECAILAEHRKSGDQAKGTYIPNPCRGYDCNG